MKVLVSHKHSFNQSQFNDVTSISYANDTYTIVTGGVSRTFSKFDFIVFIIN